MSSEQPFKGKVAIVTGSSKLNGIGAAIALGLAKKGASILVHYSSAAGPAEEVVKAIEAVGARSIAVKADASAADFGTVLVNAALKGFQTNTIDIVVNNAGTAAMTTGIADVPFEQWDQVFHVNVRGPFLLIQAALPYMKTGGRIINVSSIIARLGSYMLPVYGASKGALNALTLALAEELGPKGITINTLSPGPIDTDLAMEGSPVAARLEANQHIKRMGTTRECAIAAEYLAHPDASYVTGQLIAVDGGIHLP
ncbi:hypothetical protein BGZ63DRAFT_360623 [Mariannaea sp. PMI_226]|nr:hypothetical protein BGZ63DRAFT_360623 [Mariannaea sp. PMI_226]